MNSKLRSVVAGWLLTLTLSPFAAAQCTRCGPNTRVTPKSLTFAKRVIGTVSAPKNLTVTNLTPHLVQLNVSTTLPFHSVGCGGSLGAHKSCTIQVRFAPTATGPVTGNTLVRDGSATGGGTVQLAGTGFASAAINEAGAADALKAQATAAEGSVAESTATIKTLRYRIFDVGTFGGPTSQTNGGSRVVNNAGTVVGVADTAKACPYFPAFPVSPAFAWQDGVLKNIGRLPGGCGSLPNAISSNGLIAGSSDNGRLDPFTGFPELRGDFRKDGRIFNLGTFGGSHSLSGDVNTHGLVVGAAENKDPDPFDFGGSIVGGLPSPTAWHAYLWREGTTIKDLGTLGGPDSFAFFVNEHDEIAGISFTNSTVNQSTGVPTLAPFFWKNGKMKNIGSFGGTFGTLQFLNDESQMVGFSALPGDFVAHAYVWAPGKGMKDLGTLGGTFSVSDWINNNGVVVGGSTTLNDEAFVATRWRNARIENLGTAGGNGCSSAFQINERGEIAGQSFNCDGTGVAHATLWEPTGPAIDLNLFLPPDSNLQLAETHFVNDRGELVVVGVLPDGNPHIVVMVPCTGTETEGCRGPREDASIAQQQLSFSNNTRLTLEMLAAIKKRAIRRFAGFPGAKP